MAVFRAEKVVSQLPDPLEPDTIYYVRTGEGFDIFVSDITGSVAHKLNDVTGLAQFPETPPSNPKVGAIWINPADMSAYVYYDDGTSAQWVSVIGRAGLNGAKGDKGDKGEKGDTGAVGPAADPSKVIAFSLVFG